MGVYASWMRPDTYYRRQRYKIIRTITYFVYFYNTQNTTVNLWRYHYVNKSAIIFIQSKFHFFLYLHYYLHICGMKTLLVFRFCYFCYCLCCCFYFWIKRGYIRLLLLTPNCLIVWRLLLYARSLRTQYTRLYWHLPDIFVALTMTAPRCGHRWKISIYYMNESVIHECWIWLNAGSDV